MERCKNCGGKRHVLENCPFKDKGSRCFRCNEFGHRSRECRTQVEVKVKQSFEWNVSNWKINLWHGRSEVVALLYTGFADAFIRKTTFNRFEYTPRASGPASIVNVWGNGIKTLGAYTIQMNFNLDGYYIECYVVSDEDIPAEMVLGTNFLRDVDMVVKNGKVEIKRAKIQQQSEDRSSSDDENTIVPSGQKKSTPSTEVSRFVKDGRVGTGTE